MRAISIRQPFADWIMSSLKTFEIRSRNTKIRGRVYVYASMKPGMDKGIMKSWNLPTGQIIGSVEIVDSVKRGNEYHWFLRKPKLLKKPLKPKKQPQPVFFNPF